MKRIPSFLATLIPLLHVTAPKVCSATLTPASASPKPTPRNRLLSSHARHSIFTLALVVSNARAIPATAHVPSQSQIQTQQSRTQTMPSSLAKQTQSISRSVLVSDAASMGATALVRQHLLLRISQRALKSSPPAHQSTSHSPPAAAAAESTAVTMSVQTTPYSLARRIQSMFPSSPAADAAVSTAATISVLILKMGILLPSTPICP